MNDKYLIINKIGSGNMGEVYLVEDKFLHKRYAMKCIFAHNYSENDYLLRKKSLKYECYILSKLENKNIPYVIELIDEDDYTAFIYEYIEGTTLDELIEKNFPLDYSKIVDIFLKLLDIFNYIHGLTPCLIYRDLKPSNIIICNDEVYLIDFGAVVEGYSNVIPKDSVGTLGFCAPEQLKGANASVKSDIYSLGAILNYMITGIDPTKPPYENGNLNDIYNKRYISLGTIIDKCMNIDEKKRYSNVNAIKSELNNVNLINYDLFKYLIFGSYYLALFAVICFTMASVHLGNVQFMLTSIGISIILYIYSKYIEKRYFKHNFIIKRNVNIIYTEKKHIGLM